MVPSRLLANRCIPQIVYRAPVAIKYTSLLFLSLRRRGSRKSLWTAAAPNKRTAAADSALDEGTANGRAMWGEKEFGSLQKKASSRLHRFYVPQPLGPKAATASLDSFLKAAAAPSASGLRASPDPAAAAAATATAAGGGGGAPPPAPSVVLEGEEARHASRALRLQPGDRVELCDGLGNLVEGLVSGSDRQRVWVAPDGPCVHVPWAGSRWVVAVACTTLKGGRAEWLVEKLTELGAFMMVPLVTERSQAGGKAKFRTRGSSASSRGDGCGAAAAAFDGNGRDGDSDGGDYQPGRLERVAIAATKQSLRPHALHLTPPTPLTELLPLVRMASAACGDGGGVCRTTELASAPGPGAEQCCSGNGSGRAAAGGVVSHGAPAATKSSIAPEASGGGDGGGGNFCLVAVAGAPPLAAVFRGVRGSRAVDDRHVDGCGAGTKPSGGGEPVPEAPLRVLFIGPEGDFTPAELAALVEAGARPVGLGANRLRTETAAVGLLAACLLTEE